MDRTGTARSLERRPATPWSRPGSVASPAVVHGSASSASGPSGLRLPHLPALDGLRALALVSVLLFHGGVSWVGGGYLPLTAFFVLSGFLITSLLLLERQRNGWVDLRAFWGRRARRLVPAALVALALILVFAAATEARAGLRGDVFAALGWVANWRFILDDQSYADLWGDPSPLQHFWSLAVEEQFYVVLPLLATGTLWLARGRRWLFGVATAALVVGSTLWMRYLYEPGEAPLRSYFGTDTRAAELLVGVLLALVLVGPRGLRRIRGAGRWVVEMAGAAALVGTVALWLLSKEYDSYLYDSGGLLGIALLAAVVVAAATQQGSLVSTLLGLRPLAALGRVSYGVYLFHWPLFLWLDEERTGLEGTPLLALRLGATLALAVVSYRLLEQPIRLGRRVRPPVLLTGWANATAAVAAVLVLVTHTTVEPAITLETAGAPQVQRAERRPTVVAGASGSSTSSTGPSTTTTADGGATDTTRTGSGARSGTPSAPRGGSEPGTTAPTQPSAPTTPDTEAPPPPPPPLKVAVAGDSIATNLAEGLLAVQDKYQIDVLTLALNGCSAVVEGELRFPNGVRRQVDGGCKQRRSQWGSSLREFRPDVVLIHSSIFDILDRQVAGWPDFLWVGDPTFDAWLAAQQRQIVSELGATGARVVWATTPCAQFNPTLNGNHHENGEGNRRINLLNQLIRRSGATIADLYGKVCPGGQYSATVFGVSGARAWDGVHFNKAGSAAMADQWLAPLLLGYR